MTSEAYKVSKLLYCTLVLTPPHLVDASQADIFNTVAFGQKETEQGSAPAFVGMCGSHKMKVFIGR
jgi:hypothetical protein